MALDQTRKPSEEKFKKRKEKRENIIAFVFTFRIQFNLVKYLIQALGSRSKFFISLNSMERNGGKGREEEQDGMSVHSPCKAPPSSASSLPKEQSQVELELRLLEALEIYPPVKLQGIHRHFVLYGLMEFLRRSFDRHFSADEVLQLLERFYNLEMLKPDDEETDILNHEEDFSLPQSFFVKEEP